MADSNDTKTDAGNWKEVLGVALKHAAGQAVEATLCVCFVALTGMACRVIEKKIIDNPPPAPDSPDESADSAD